MILHRLAAFGFLAISALAASPQAPGVPNFHQVDDRIYRGAQPAYPGFQSLADLGVKTVIDLRSRGARSAAEEKVVNAAGMRYISVPLRGFAAPPDGDVSKLLALLADTSAGPVFIHCRRGADRTGTICACYRITHDHWENSRALEEAMSFGMSRLERAMRFYILHYPLESPALPALPNAVPVVP